jgi:hypothetical protein
MTDETTNGTEKPPEPKPEAAAQEEQSVILVSYPKIVFLYPTLIASIICGLCVWLSGAKDGPEEAMTANDSATEVAADAADGTDGADTEETAASADEEDKYAGSHFGHVVGRLFLLVLAINLVVISFDFPRTTSLTLFFFVVAVGVILWMVFRLNPNMLPGVTGFINSIQPFGNPTFYFMFALIMICLYIGVAISARFDYWEVRPNELLHHHGVLSDLERFSAPNLRINKEINDVFEYLLLRSGRLIVHASSERKAIVLENVFFINRKETQITRMLGALQVQVREQSPS